LLESYIVKIFIAYEIEGSQKYWNVTPDSLVRGSKVSEEHTVFN